MSTVISQSDQLTVYTQPRPFAVIRPERLPPRNIGLIVDPTCWVDAIDTVIRVSCEPGEVVALDFETRGTDPTLPDNYIVGMALVGSEFAYYFDRTQDPDGFDRLLIELVESDVRLIAHNVYFDGSWSLHQCGVHLKWEACTYALYRLLATEGWTGQRWGLKDAMTDVLLWDDTNEEGIDGWLVSNGYHTPQGRPVKQEMWRVPAEILGQYCILDAEATYLLYTRVLRPAMQRFPALEEYFRNDFLPLILRLIEQKLHGILVDREQLLRAQAEITAELGPLEEYIRTESELAPHISAWEKLRYEEFRETEPAHYRKAPKLGAEPAYHLKDGVTVSKTWLNWNRKRTAPPVESLVWKKWEEKRSSIAAGENPDYKFNLRSGDHLRWLFYDRLGHQPLEYTKGGQPKCDTDTLRAFGAGGAEIEKFHLLHKELSFVEAYLELTETRPTVHPGFMVPGTLTGRLSGKEPNIQQVTKSRRFLSALRARPGHVWIDADFTALEPVVLTELSRDPQLMQVFGPEAKPGADIYLHTGLGFEQYRDQIIAAGYDPENITPEGTAACKRALKRERSDIFKPFYLSSIYGAGAGKKYKTLRQNGANIPFDVVKDMNDGFWDFYAGIKGYERNLREEHRINKGWVANGIGRPIGVHQDSDRKFDKRKDIVNRVVQSTGHDLLVRYLRILCGILDNYGIHWKPIIIDFHDEVLIEVPEAEQELTIQAFRMAQSELNCELQGLIPLRINPVVVHTLADAKLED